MSWEDKLITVTNEDIGLPDGFRIEENIETKQPIPFDEFMAAQGDKQEVKDAGTTPGKSSWLDDAVVVGPNEPPIDKFAQYEVGAPQPASRPIKFMDWNLQKALRNQGVDPATMQVTDPSHNWGFFKKIVRSINAGDAQFKMDIRMGQAAESEVDIYASVRSDELLYEHAVKANPIISHNIIEQDIFNTARSWGYYTAGGGDIEIMGGVAIGLVMAFAIIKYFHKNSALRA